MSNRNLTANKTRLLGWIAEIDRAIHEIGLAGTASATVSSSGGSKSYSRIDIEKLEALRETYARRVSQINRALRSGTPAGIRHVLTVRS